jgi:DNA polymerase III alpha subunit
VVGAHVSLCGRLDRGDRGCTLIVQEIGTRRVNWSVSEAAGRRDGDIIAVRGTVLASKTVYTRRGDPVGFVTLADGSSRLEALIFAGVIRRDS